MQKILCWQCYLNTDSVNSKYQLLEGKKYQLLEGKKYQVLEGKKYQLLEGM